jgi:hypothetical protein
MEGQIEPVEAPARRYPHVQLVLGHGHVRQRRRRDDVGAGHAQQREENVGRVVAFERSALAASLSAFAHLLPQRPRQAAPPRLQAAPSLRSRSTDDLGDMGNPGSQQKNRLMPQYILLADQRGGLSASS